MAKITRKLLKVFGLSGASDNFAKFGSEVAGAPIKTKDIELIQSLSAWDNGLQDAVVAANKAPYIEDINALIHVLAYQSAYTLQEGIAEWNTDSVYYIGSVVKKTGTTELYASLTDDNTGNALGAQLTNTNWQYLGTLASLPQAGTINMFGGAAAPTGWLLCDGSAISRTTYANLFAVIGTTFGAGNGSTTFNLPDMQDKFPMGKSGTKALGSTAGSNTIAEANLPAHTHIQNAHSHGITDVQHSHTVQMDEWEAAQSTTARFSSNDVTPTAVATSSSYTGITGTQAATATNQNTGSGTAYYQPYVAVNYIIKI